MNVLTITVIALMKNDYLLIILMVVRNAKQVFYCYFEVVQNDYLRFK